VVNPVHERLIADLLTEVAPEMYVSQSVDVSPRLGEYERMVASVINGYVGPACRRYLGDLADSLHRDGLSTPLLVVQSNGGVLPAAGPGTSAVRLVCLGPRS
jgi:N-methylhydantoinase A